jgi:hypothetical protein
VVLAGDLVHDNDDPLRGWRIIHDDNHVGDTPVQVVNVAHHASAGAHYHPLWQAMAPQLAIVTPYQNASGSNPPRPADIGRLLDSGSEVVVTSKPNWDRNRGDGPWPVIDPGKEQAPAEHTPRRRRRRPSAGHANLVTSAARKHLARRNAVAVTLDHDGAIQSITLAGAAAFYAAPEPA